MTTKLEGPLKRELKIGRVDYTLTIAPEGMTLALKGKRKGLELAWTDLVSGDAALATALNASLTAKIEAPPPAPGAKEAVKRTASSGRKRSSTRTARLHGR
jgi:hypothetical protein